MKYTGYKEYVRYTGYREYMGYKGYKGEQIVHGLQCIRTE